MNELARTFLKFGILLAVLGSQAGARAQETRIQVQAEQVFRPVSRLLTGACIEEVIHEIYGGNYSQMIFGESFQEPAPPLTLKGFTAYGGRWSPQFDAHVGTDGPRPDASFDSMFSFYDGLDKIADGAKHKVVVFESNAGNPAIQRALANALATQAIRFQ